MNKDDLKSLKELYPAAKRHYKDQYGASQEPLIEITGDQKLVIMLSWNIEVSLFLSTVSNGGTEMKAGIYRLGKDGSLTEVKDLEEKSRLEGFYEAFHKSISSPANKKDQIKQWEKICNLSSHELYYHLRVADIIRSKDELRPHMNSVLINFDSYSDRISLSSTDGFMLVDEPLIKTNYTSSKLIDLKKTYRTLNLEGTLNLVKSLGFMTRYTNPIDIDTDLSLNHKAISLSNSKWEIYFTQTQNIFPDAEPVLHKAKNIIENSPKGDTYRLEYSPNELHKEIKYSTIVLDNSVEPNVLIEDESKNKVKSVIFDNELDYAYVGGFHSLCMSIMTTSKIGVGEAIQKKLHAISKLPPFSKRKANVFQNNTESTQLFSFSKDKSLSNCILDYLANPKTVSKPKSKPVKKQESNPELENLVDEVLEMLLKEQRRDDLSSEDHNIIGRCILTISSLSAQQDLEMLEAFLYVMIEQYGNESNISEKHIKSVIKEPKTKVEPKVEPKTEPKNTTTPKPPKPTKDIRDLLTLEEFIESGINGLGILSRLIPSGKKKAISVMNESIKFGYAERHDYGRGKGKYRTTEEADELDITYTEMFTNVYNRVPVSKASITPVEEEDEDEMDALLSSLADGVIDLDEELEEDEELNDLLSSLD